MIVALTGTPGTGKTSVANLLKKNQYHVENLNEIAFENKFLLGVDKKRQSKIIDIPRLNRYIKKTYTTNDIVIIEGLATHLLKCAEKIIVLRCHPKELTKRLEQKGWSAEKIKENVEAETLDIILCETTEIHPEQNIFEIDTTHLSLNEVANAIIYIIKNNFKPIEKYTIGKIDWSEEILKDFTL
jgi:adenylate kinase